MLLLTRGRPPRAAAVQNWSLADGSVCTASGFLTRSQATAVLDSLRRGQTPQAPQVPWVVGRADADGSVLASCSPMWRSGLFFCCDDDTFCLATDPGQVIAMTGGQRHLDPDYLIDFLAMRAPADSTPIAGVRRLEPGVLLQYRDGRVRTRQWCGPRVWPAPFREGPQVPEEYLDTFDAAVDDAVAVAGTPVLMLSGGLDSTFLAASLTRHVTVRDPLVGLVHRPARAASIAKRPAVEADEWSFARELAQMYHGLVRLEPLVNDAAVCALDAALEQSQRAWMPVLNPANAIWTERALRRGAELGANAVFSGGSGNFTYSNPHKYALAHLMRTGQWVAAQRVIAQMAAQRGRWRALREASAMLRERDEGIGDYVRLFDMRPEALGHVRNPGGRAQYVERLAGLGSSHAGANNPARQRGVLELDPFRAPAMVRLAAEMTTREWTRYGLRRGYARMLAEGRVPDSIRLRRTRGGQGLDAWWAARQHRERYLAAAGAVADTVVLADVIDHRALLARVRGWDWTDPYGPPFLEFLAVERLLHVAEHVRWLVSALRGDGLG